MRKEQGMKKLYEVRLVHSEVLVYEVVADCSVDAELQAKELCKRESMYQGRFTSYDVSSVKMVEVLPEVPPSQEVLRERHKRDKKRRRGE